MMTFADNNEFSLIFNNTKYISLSEKILKLKREMTNPYVTIKNWLEDEELDVEAMLIAIMKINQLIEEFEKKQDKYIKHSRKGNFIKGIFKKKDNFNEKENMTEKVNDLMTLIKIVEENMQNQIEVFKMEKTQNYYKNLKNFAISQKMSNKVVRELWTLIKNVMNNISPNAGEDEDYPIKPMY